MLRIDPSNKSNESALSLSLSLLSRLQNLKGVTAKY